MESNEKTKNIAWSFDAGHIALNFANTCDWHAGPHPEELLNSYSDLVNWSQDFDVLNQQQTDNLLQEAAKHPQNASTALENAQYLRETIYRIFTAISANKEPARADLEYLKHSYVQAAAAVKITPDQHGFSLDWLPETPDFEQMLWPISHAAFDLLLSAELAKVGQCADDRGCGALFIDTSRNHSRNWCSMEVCGNRAKAQRHYQRSR